MFVVGILAVGFLLGNWLNACSYAMSLPVAATPTELPAPPTETAEPLAR